MVQQAHTIPIPNPGGGGQYNISPGDQITITMFGDGYFSYTPAISFTNEKIPQGDFHLNDVLGPYVIENSGPPETVTLSLFDGMATWTCVLTIPGSPAVTA